MKYFFLQNYSLIKALNEFLVKKVLTFFLETNTFCMHTLFVHKICSRKSSVPEHE